jgi:hypothetical protein
VAESTKKGSGPLKRPDTENYSPDRNNLGHARGRKYLDAMHEVYAACAAALKPGGYLVLVTKDMRSGGGLQDLSGNTNPGRTPFMGQPVVRVGGCCCVAG